MNRPYQPPHFPGLVNSELRNIATHCSYDFLPEDRRLAASVELKHREAAKINYMPIEKETQP